MGLICKLMGHKWYYTIATDKENNQYEIRVCERCDKVETLR